MPYEVEMKFPVADMAAFEAKLTQLGATISTPQIEIDTYFKHPSRDFAQTDEALRIRRKAAVNSITYKGPKIDPVTKTRREIDLPLPPGEETAGAWPKLLEALGFAPVGEVRKSRRKAQLDWQGQCIEVSLDQIDRVGTFVELELIAESNDVETAKSCIISAAKSLGLEASERRSYLELLLDKK